MLSSFFKAALSSSLLYFSKLFYWGSKINLQLSGTTRKLDQRYEWKLFFSGVFWKIVDNYVKCLWFEHPNNWHRSSLRNIQTLTQYVKTLLAALCLHNQFQFQFQFIKDSPLRCSISFSRGSQSLYLRVWSMMHPYNNFKVHHWPKIAINQFHCQYNQFKHLQQKM